MEDRHVLRQGLPGYAMDFAQDNMQSTGAHPRQIPHLESTADMLSYVGTTLESDELRACVLETAPAGVSTKSEARPFTALKENTLLHDLPETETSGLLIDCFRQFINDVEQVGYVPPELFGDYTTPNARLANLIYRRDFAEVLLVWWNIE
ncbi:hypothetical protein LTR95_005890 [Oleoguttula sp. CCFEE 5521]